ncbi:unnamed protein product [Amoebophrya sp. A25]|nr:unnamed protein product [Amoebophrya sp. A25]|eukprot:GSA25T00001962001.1
MAKGGEYIRTCASRALNTTGSNVGCATDATVASHVADTKSVDGGNDIPVTRTTAAETSGVATLVHLYSPVVVEKDCACAFDARRNSRSTSCTSDADAAGASTDENIRQYQHHSSTRSPALDREDAELERKLRARDDASTRISVIQAENDNAGPNVGSFGSSSARALLSGEDMTTRINFTPAGNLSRHSQGGISRALEDCGGNGSPPLATTTSPGGRSPESPPGATATAASSAADHVEDACAAGVSSGGIVRRKSGQSNQSSNYAVPLISESGSPRRCRDASFESCAVDPRSRDLERKPLIAGGITSPTHGIKEAQGTAYVSKSVSTSKVPHGMYLKGTRRDYNALQVSPSSLSFGEDQWDEAGEDRFVSTTASVPRGSPGRGLFAKRILTKLRTFLVHHELVLDRTSVSQPITSTEDNSGSKFAGCPARTSRDDRDNYSNKTRLPHNNSSSSSSLSRTWLSTTISAVIDGDGPNLVMSSGGDTKTNSVRDSTALSATNGVPVSSSSASGSTNPGFSMFSAPAQSSPSGGERFLNEQPRAGGLMIPGSGGAGGVGNNPPQLHTKRTPVAMLRQMLGPMLTRQLLFSIAFGMMCAWFNCIMQVLLDHQYVYGKVHIWPSEIEIERLERAKERLRNKDPAELRPASILTTVHPPLAGGWKTATGSSFAQQASGKLDSPAPSLQGLSAASEAVWETRPSSATGPGLPGADSLVSKPLHDHEQNAQPARVTAPTKDKMGMSSTRVSTYPESKTAPPDDRIIHNQAEFERRVAEHVLPNDIFFETLPDLRYETDGILADYAYLFNSDALLAMAMQLSALVFLLCHPKRGRLLPRFLVCQGAVFFLRGISIIVTPLPPPDGSCLIGDPAIDENYIWEGFKAVWRQRVTCCDVLFSGHTTNFTLLFLLWWDNFDENVCSLAILRFFVRRAVLLYMLFGYFSMLVRRFHYTVDLFLGAAISFLTWRFYHSQVALYRVWERLSHVEALRQRSGWGAKLSASARQVEGTKDVAHMAFFGADTSCHQSGLIADDESASSSTSSCVGLTAGGGGDRAPSPSEVRVNLSRTSEYLQQAEENQQNASPVGTSSTPTEGGQHESDLLVINAEGGGGRDHTPAPAPHQSGVLYDEINLNNEILTDDRAGVDHLNHSQHHVGQIVPQDGRDVREAFQHSGVKNASNCRRSPNDSLYPMELTYVVDEPCQLPSVSGTSPTLLGYNTSSSIFNRGRASSFGGADAFLLQQVDLYDFGRHLSGTGTPISFSDEPADLRSFDPVARFQNLAHNLFIWFEFAPREPFFGLRRGKYNPFSARSKETVAAGANGDESGNDGSSGLFVPS